MVRTWRFYHCVPNSVPGLGAEIPHQVAAYHGGGKDSMSDLHVSSVSSIFFLISTQNNFLRSYQPPPFILVLFF